MSVRFSIQPAREASGGRKYPERVLIHLPTDGGLHEVVRPATEDDKRKYRTEYALLKPKVEAPKPKR